MFCIKFLLLSLSIVVVFSASTPQATLRVQPELDNIDAPKYLKNDKLVRHQFKCILYDAPCDVIGKWVKPRMPSLIVGECDFCTKKQAGWLSDWYETLKEKYPNEYKIAMEKFKPKENIETDSKAQQDLDSNAVGKSLDNNNESEKTKTTSTATTETKKQTTTATPVSSTVSEATTNSEQKDPNSENPVSDPQRVRRLRRPGSRYSRPRHSEW